VHVENAARKIHLAPPGQKSYGTVECCISKENLDGKSPPKSPFLIEIAMKTSVDVFFFSVPCYLNCLLSSDQPLTNDEAIAFWAKIPQANETSFELVKSHLYDAFKCDSKQSFFIALSKGFSLNGFSYFIKDGNLNCNAKTVNGLPILFYFASPDNASNLRVTYKAPVAPLKPLIEEIIRFILTR
jgi:hypothetical protein